MSTSAFLIINNQSILRQISLH